MRELEAQALALAPVISAAIAKALAPLREQLAAKDEAIADLVKRLDELPEPIAPDLEAIAALVKLPEVKDGEPGKDAAEVDLDALAKAAAALVELPEPIAPDLEAIAKLVVLPEVKDGKDADPIDLEALAGKVLSMIPAPKDGDPGKDAEPIDLKAVAALVEVPAAPEVDLEALAGKAAALIPVPVIPEPEHGRDAIDLEILPAIDEAKQYPRGTYAAHRGGLWKSFERTHGMRGWECIVEGLADVTVTQDSVREFSVTLNKSSGVNWVQKFQLPIQVYKGVYRDDETYEAHDNVTWAGSQWTSTKAENTDKPGSSDAWTLVVKAGRPGKDLRENASTFDPAKGVKL